MNNSSDIDMATDVKARPLILSLPTLVGTASYLGMDFLLTALWYNIYDLDPGRSGKNNCAKRSHEHITSILSEMLVLYTYFSVACFIGYRYGGYGVYNPNTNIYHVSIIVRA